MAATAASTVLGTPAPDFRLPATDGKTYTLADIARTKGTVIVLLVEAMRAIAAGKFPSHQTPSVGCSIKWKAA